MNANASKETISTDRDVPLGILASGKEKRGLTLNPMSHRNSGAIHPGEISKKFLQKNFPLTSPAEWNDWKWQIRNSFTSVSQINTIFEPSGAQQKKLLSPEQQLPFRITPYYAALLANPGNNAIRKTMLPSINELHFSPGEYSDPLHEEESSPVPHLVHRYPDRVLFLATGFCSSYCRYCTRTHMVAKEKVHFNKEWEPAIDYIRQHKEIRDVLISGGDPLTMPDKMLYSLLSAIRKIPHVEIIRIGTKVPTVLPQRITYSLIRILEQFHPLMISIHFTHPAELTPETSEACIRLANAGIPLGSQTVLLKGINDNIPVMKKLMQGLLKIRVKPYYLYQCDPIPGSLHFRTPVSKGLEIIHGLRGFTSGYAVPAYVIDAPGGGGKIPLLPNYVQGKKGKNIVLKNYEGKTFYYPDTAQEL